MKRILISQKEYNDGKDYVVVDGALVTDDGMIAYYGRFFSKTALWKQIYKDEFVEIRVDKNNLFLKSFYNDKDISDRAIYYVYIVDENDDYNKILDYLDEDSKLISRSYDREHIQMLLQKLQNNDRLKKTLISYIAIAIVVLCAGYLLVKLFK